jgi:Lantibiotic biosynthesis dehydratase C-term
MTTWVSLHVFHHGDLDTLLLDAVRPLAADLRRAALIDGFFFLRYWDGGPHLRLRLSAVRAAEVRGTAVARLRDHLAAHPSPDLPGLDRYPEVAARLAAAEGVTGHLRVPMPNNTVHEIAYRPETGRYGEGRSLARAERHFVESSRIALGLIAAGTSRDRRRTAAFCALVLAWQGRPPHPPARDDDHERHYRRTRPVLHDLAVRAARITAGAPAPPGSGALTAWWRTVRTLPDPAVRDLCAHLFCNRLGITPGEEHRLRYLACRTLTSESGER